MNRKLVLTLTLTLLVGMLNVAFNVQRAKASGTIYLRADGSIDPPDAPISTVDNVTYTFTADVYESIEVQRDNIFVDGANHVIEGSSGYGVYLSYRNNVTVRNTRVSTFPWGIWLSYSNNTKLYNNTLTGNDDYGIGLSYSHSNTLIGNTATGIRLYYGIGLSNSNNNTLYGNTAMYNGAGGYITGHAGGIGLINSNNNTLSDNKIANNDMFGIDVYMSNCNKLYHNNLINDLASQASTYESYNNVWDDGYPSGGNYWQLYTGVDFYGGPYQNETGSDGICDTPIIIDANNTDRYPLMGMFSDFNATSEHTVQIICNSTVSDFHFNGTTTSFNVTGEDGTAGFCRICIPTALMNDTYRVFVNGTEVPCNVLACSNSTHSYLYFTYGHSTKEIVIVPEYASLIILPLFMTATLLAVIIYRKKSVKTSQT